MSPFTMDEVEVRRVIRNDEDVAEGLAWLADHHPDLLPVIEQAGPLPLRLAEPGFEGLAHIVVSQMVSKASAAAIWRRMEQSGATTAAGLLACPDTVRGTLGLSGAKLRTLMMLAGDVTFGRLCLESLSDLPEVEAYEELVRLHGIGPWTAEVYLMFCLGSPDIFPAGDVALRVAIGRAFGMEERPSISQVIEIAEAWSPWRSVAARLFWAYYASAVRRDGMPSL